LKQITWIILGWLILMTTAWAAGFDCAKANSKTEKMICESPDLSELDSKMSEKFNKSLAQNEAKSENILKQRQWLKKVRNVCQNKQCLKTAYQVRLEELTNRQAQGGKLQPEEGEYVVRCDKHKQTLIVSDASSLPEIKSSDSIKDISDYLINPSSLTKIGGTDRDALRLPAGKKLYQCQLGRVRYKITID
jgi:uncharacterized protein